MKRLPFPVQIASLPKNQAAEIALFFDFNSHQYCFQLCRFIDLQSGINVMQNNFLQFPTG
jgi:hypothetical protein